MTWQQCNLLFVYGSLREESNHPMGKRLHQSGQFMEKGYLPNAILFDLGPYPAIKLSNLTTHGVVGDIVKLPDDAQLLDDLDRYEGISAPPSRSDEYQRLIRSVSSNSGEEFQCWVYVWNHGYPPGRMLPSGDWLSEKRLGSSSRNGFS